LTNGFIGGILYIKMGNQHKANVKLETEGNKMKNSDKVVIEILEGLIKAAEEDTPITEFGKEFKEGKIQGMQTAITILKGE